MGISDCLGFLRKIHVMLKIGWMGYFLPQDNIFEVFSKSVPVVFWNYIWREAFKNGSMWLFEFLRNETFLGPKIQKQEIHKIYSIDFSEILCNDRHCKKK